MTPGWGRTRQGCGAQGTLPSLLLPLRDQLSYRCNSECRERQLLGGRKRGFLGHCMQMCVCVCALHGGNCDSLFVCISEHPPCGSVYTCRETRKRFHLECYPTFRNSVWNYCPCFGCMMARGRCWGGMLTCWGSLLREGTAGAHITSEHLPVHSCHGILRRVSH